MEIGESIVFSDTIFGGVINPQTVYYIKSIVDANEFTISATSVAGVPGPTLVLTNASGGAIGITNDYAFGIADNGISAKIIFAAQYDDTQDYLTYTVFGETFPDQYGYTIPEIQLITGDNTTGPFTLTNYVSGDNPLNAIVEVNGVRILDTAYTINDVTNTLTFTSLTPSSSDTIAVTSYNLTERQYFNTQYNITGRTVSEISFINNNITVGQPAVRVTTVTNHGLTTDDIVRIDGVTGSIQLNNNIYYVDVINTTQFDLYYSEVIDDDPVISVNSYTGGGYVWLDETFTIISEYNQTNVDRLWVTINGYRVPSSALVLNGGDNLSILLPIITTDSITITSMIPSATPNQLVYLQNVNKNQIGSVYRANIDTRTWLVEPLYYTNDTIYVSDITRITDTVLQNVVAPAAVDGIISIGLDADKNTISQVIVYNTTTSSYVATSNYSVVIVDLSPKLEIIGGVVAGNNLVVTTIEGNLIYINGEQIRFTTVDLANNTITGLQRGSNGTGILDYIPTYSEVFGILSNNLLPSVNYNLTWNSNIYNVTDGDPLQISETNAAYFLNSGVS
jgi:hypothetical protein